MNFEHSWLGKPLVDYASPIAIPPTLTLSLWLLMFDTLLRKAGKTHVAQVQAGTQCRPILKYLNMKQSYKHNKTYANRTLKLLHL